MLLTETSSEIRSQFMVAWHKKPSATITIANSSFFPLVVSLESDYAFDWTSSEIRSEIRMTREAQIASSSLFFLLLLPLTPLRQKLLKIGRLMKSIPLSGAIWRDKTWVILPSFLFHYCLYPIAYTMGLGVIQHDRMTLNPRAQGSYSSTMPTLYNSRIFLH